MSFERRLKALDSRLDYRKNRFVRLVQSGKLPLANLLGYAHRVHWIAKSFPHRLARLLTICPTSEVRAHVIANLAEEEGFMLGEGAAGAHHPDRQHVVFAERFLQAVQARCPEPSRTPPPPTTDWYERAEQEGRWLACAAYIFVGIEASVSRVNSLLVAPLHKHYGFTNKELEHFILHIAADKTHAKVGMRLILDHAKTSEQEEEAYEGACRGARTWWGSTRSSQGVAAESPA